MRTNYSPQSHNIWMPDKLHQLSDIIRKKCVRVWFGPVYSVSLKKST